LQRARDAIARVECDGDVRLAIARREAFMLPLLREV
jgi:hypothetical protein